MENSNQGPGCGGPAQDFAPERTPPKIGVCCGRIQYDVEQLGKDLSAYIYKSGEMKFSNLQKLVADWQDYNFGPQAPYRQLLGVAEEFGELCHAQLKLEQGIRGTPEEHKAAAKDAVGDILIFLSNYCTGQGFDLQQIAEDTWAEISKRDWKKFPKNGISE